MASTSGRRKTWVSMMIESRDLINLRQKSLVNLLNIRTGKGRACAAAKVAGSDDAQQETKQDARCQFHISLRAEAPIIPAVYRSAETLRYLRSIALF